MHWGPHPDWQRGSGVGSHPASSRAPQRETWLPGRGCGAGHQAREWGWGCHVLAWLRGQAGLPQTATRGQQAPSAEEFSVAQVMAS